MVKIKLIYSTRFFCCLFFLLNFVSCINDQKAKEQKIILDETLFISEINGIWRNGLIGLSATVKKSLIQNCPMLFPNNMKFPNDFYQCRPELIDCYLGSLESNTISINTNKAGKLKNIEFKIIHDGRLAVSRLGVEFFYHDWQINLIKNCHEVILPQQSHLLIVNEKLHETWDNFRRKIVIDKYPIIYADLYLDRDFVQAAEIQKQNLNRKLTEYVNDLTPVQMENYCFKQGKKLLTQDLLVAATQFSGNLNKQYSDKVFYHPFLTGPGKKNQYLENHEYQMQENDCLFQYTLECNLKNYPYEFMSTDSISTIGVVALNGPNYELVKDRFSTKYLVHQAGQNFSRMAPQQKIGQFKDWSEEYQKIQFRCYYEEVIK